MKNLKDEKGQALIEFTMILPILCMLVMGILEFGIMLNSYLSVENATREGARAGIIGSSDVEIKNKIISTSPSLEEENLIITITPQEAYRKRGETLTVQVTYKHKLFIPVINKLLSDRVELSGQTSMRIE